MILTRLRFFGLFWAFWVLVNDNWSRWPWPKLVYHGYWAELMTFMTVISEGLVPVLIWFKKATIPVVFTMIFFHATIAVVLKNVTFFSLSMVCGLICFLPGDWTRRMFKSANLTQLS